MIDRNVQRMERLLRRPAVLFGGGLVLAALAAVALVAAFPLYKPLLEAQFSFSIIVLAVMLLLILNATALCILAERKIAAFTQDRRGPNRVVFEGGVLTVRCGANSRAPAAKSLENWFRKQARAERRLH